MFDGIAPFCESTFLAVYKTFFYQAITGVLMEGHFHPAGLRPGRQRLRAHLQRLLPVLVHVTAVHPPLSERPLPSGVLVGGAEPLRDVPQRHGLTAYRRVLALATDEQRPHLDRYMRAFIHWHFRYRWQSIYPCLAPLEV